MLTRRSILRGLFAAPAIVSASSIMPVKLWDPNAWLADCDIATEAAWRTEGLWRTYSEIDSLAVKLYSKQLAFEASASSPYSSTQAVGPPYA
jgi:hypothetical protein